MAHVPPYNPRYKEYVRQDAAYRDVAGTNIWRLKKPKSGNWRQITDGTACCFPYTALTYTPSDVTDDDFTLLIKCDSTTMLLAKVKTATATTTIDELVTALNTQYSYLGQFAVDGSAIDFNLKQDVSDVWLCSGTLSFTVIPT